MDRFRVAQTLVQATQFALAAALAGGTGLAPIYQLPQPVALGMVVLTGFLGVVSAQMPSWSASGTVSRAATAAEAPPPA